jgi:hypothetical protein
MNAIKVVGRRKAPQTPEEFHALGARLDREAALLRASFRSRGFVFKARTWKELERWEANRLARRVSRGGADE